MNSLPGGATMPSWANRIRWETSLPFRVKWLAEGLVSCFEEDISVIRNDFDNGKVVTKGFDCQEISPGARSELCRILDAKMNAGSKR